MMDNSELFGGCFGLIVGGACGMGLALWGENYLLNYIRMSQWATVKQHSHSAVFANVVLVALLILFVAGVIGGALCGLSLVIRLLRFDEVRQERREFANKLSAAHKAWKAPEMLPPNEEGAGESSPELGDRVLRVEIQDFGELEAPQRRKKIQRKLVGDSFISARPIEKMTFKTYGQVVAAEIDSAFGVEFRADSAKFGTRLHVTVRVLGPGNTALAEFEMPLNSGEPTIAAMGFDQVNELIAGEWNIQILAEETLMAEQQFVVHVKLGGKDAPR